MRGFVRSVLTLSMILFMVVPGAAQSGGAPCPLSPERRVLVEEVLQKTARDAVWVATNAHGLERGFALSLVGIEAGSIGTVFRIGECERRKAFDPYCEKDPETGLIRCSLLGCEGPGVDTILVSVSLGKPKLAKRTPLRYAMTTIPGEAVYDPFPSVTWRTVKAADGDGLGITADIFRRLTVTPTGGQPIDLTHMGAVAISEGGGEVTSLEILLTFPLVAPGQPQITTEISYDTAGNATGLILQGQRTLATIGSNADGLIITWQDTCAGSSLR